MATRRSSLRAVNPSPIGNDDRLTIAGLDGSTADYPGNSGGLYDLVFWPDGSKVAALAQNGTTLIWGLGEGEFPALRNLATSGGIHQLRLSSEGTAVVMESHDATVGLRVFELESGGAIAEGPDYAVEWWSDPTASLDGAVVGGPGQPGAVQSTEGQMLLTLNDCERPSAIDHDGRWVVVFEP